ncbi:MAG: Alpha amylase catalytic region [Parcubacteria group bacterium GW2011_GWA2_40_14]|nr:MAG: Alpha amylase catalytic region [Parcubacteria group bacterium GW2011_GWA2_40_14]
MLLFWHFLQSKVRKENFLIDEITKSVDNFVLLSQAVRYDNDMSKKLLVTVVLTLVFILPVFTFAQTTTKSEKSLILQLQEQIKTLQVQITNLTKQLEGQKKEIETIKTEVAFSKTLQKGMSGDEVKKLQTFLKQFPDIYPEGLVTGYYGLRTEAAVRKLQEKQGIEAIGIVGPKTLSKLNELVTEGAGSSETIPPGLLTAPGVAKKVEITTTLAQTITASSTLPITITTTVATTTGSTATSTTVSTTESSGPSSSGSGGSTSGGTITTGTITTTTATSATSDTTLPSVPAGLVVSIVSGSQINLTWTASTDNVAVTGYKIYRGGTQISTTAALATSTTISYSDTSLQASTVYSYTVAAYDAVGNNSAQSTSVSATTLSLTPPVSTLPDAPTITSITPHVPIALNQYFISSVTLQWNAVTNPTSYLTYYKAWRRLGSGDWLYWANTQQTTFPDLNLGRGTYYYYVNACHTTTESPLVLVTDNCSPNSNIMTVTLAGGGNASDTTSPGAPTGLTASIVNSDSPYISWTAGTDDVGVAGYNIYRNGTYLMSVMGTAVIDGTVSRSTTSSYTVAAYDAAGNISVQSSAVSPATVSSNSPNPRTSNLSSIYYTLDSLKTMLEKLSKLLR